MEWEVDVGDVGGFRGSGFAFDIGASLAGLSKVDDRRVTETLHLGHAGRRRRPRACDRRFDVRKIGDAGNSFLRHLGGGQARHQTKRQNEQRNKTCTHLESPCGFWFSFYVTELIEKPRSCARLTATMPAGTMWAFAILLSTSSL